MSRGMYLLVPNDPTDTEALMQGPDYPPERLEEVVRAAADEALAQAGEAWSLFDFLAAMERRGFRRLCYSYIAWEEAMSRAAQRQEKG